MNVSKLQNCNPIVRKLYDLWLRGKRSPSERLSLSEKVACILSEFGVKLSRQAIWRLERSFESGKVRVGGDLVIRPSYGIVSRREELKSHWLCGEIGCLHEVKEEIAKLQHKKPRLLPQNELIGTASAEARRSLCKKHKSIHVPFEEHRKATGELMRELYKSRVDFDLSLFSY